jgi:hypothetical protein
MSEADVASPSACKRYGAKRHYYYSVPRDLKNPIAAIASPARRRIHDLLDLALGIVGQPSAPALEVGRNFVIHGALVRFLECITQAAQQTAPVSGLASCSDKSLRSYRGAGVGHGVISSSTTDNPRNFQRTFFLLHCNIAACGGGSRGRRACNPCVSLMHRTAKTAHLPCCCFNVVAAGNPTARGRQGSRGLLAVRRWATYQPWSRKPWSSQTGSSTLFRLFFSEPSGDFP